VAIARLEQMYPWPEQPIAKLVQRFPRAEQVVWVQEEPANMGAWTFVRERLQGALLPSQKLAYAGRRASASPAVGSMRIHWEQVAPLAAARFDRPALPSCRRAAALLGAAGRENHRLPSGARGARRPRWARAMSARSRWTGVAGGARAAGLFRRGRRRRAGTTPEQAIERAVARSLRCRGAGRADVLGGSAAMQWRCSEGALLARILRCRRPSPASRARPALASGALPVHALPTRRWRRADWEFSPHGAARRFE
jgi:hypothetical protein